MIPRQAGATHPRSGFGRLVTEWTTRTPEAEPRVTYGQRLLIAEVQTPQGLQRYVVEEGPEFIVQTHGTNPLPVPLNPVTSTEQMGAPSLVAASRTLTTIVAPLS